MTIDQDSFEDFDCSEKEKVPYYLLLRKTCRL